ncbi:FxLYD domain-containing protein [Achromobacter denitrificans]
MKSALAAFALLAGLPCAAPAQEPVYGVTLGNVQAVRDVNQNLSAITGLLANQSARSINGVLLTFVLYDDQGREVGRVRDDVAGPIAPGQLKQIRAVTPLKFTRVTALDVSAR